MKWSPTLPIGTTLKGGKGGRIEQNAQERRPYFSYSRVGSQEPLIYFCRGNFHDLEFCGMLAEGNSSHGYCEQKDWPPPFHWLDFMGQLFFFYCQ